MTRALAFLLGEFLRSGGPLNETTVGFTVHVLVAGRTIQVPALMTLKSFGAHFLLEAVTTATSTKAHGGLGTGRWFASMVFGTMGFVTPVSKKVAMTLPTTSRGFETSRVSLQEIGAGFLATGPAKVFLFVASMQSFVVIGFPTVGTHVTGPEKPRQTGDDIVMALLVEQNQLFVSAGTKRRDVKGTVGVHQQDLIVNEGRRVTELGQGIVAARTWRDVSLVMEPQRQFPLDFPSLSKSVVFSGAGLPWLWRRRGPRHSRAHRYFGYE